MVQHFKKFWHTIQLTFREWMHSDPFRESAIISYYAILSLPGLMVIIAWSLAQVLGQQAISGEISRQITGALGSEQAIYIQKIITAAYLDANAKWYINIIGLAVLIFGATTFFFQLQKTLNNVWHVTPDVNNGIKRLLLSRANSMGLILVIAFLMLISLILSSILSVFHEGVEHLIGVEWKNTIQLTNIIISFLVITILFAIMYKVLPDVQFSWRAVWIGAMFTALLFNLGKYALSVYFGFSDPASGFGAAGTVILIMLWVNYTTLILLFGATFTQVFAKEYGYSIQPSRHAKWSESYILKHKDNLYPLVCKDDEETFRSLEETLAKGPYISPDQKESAYVLLEQLSLRHKTV